MNYLDSANFSFDHTREIVVSLTEEFLEHCTEGALSIEVRRNEVSSLNNLVNLQVYGHKSSVSYNAWEAEAQEAKARSLADRWSELSRKLRLDIEIQVGSDGDSLGR